MNMTQKNNNEIYSSQVKDYFSLLKLGVMGLIVFTAFAGIALADNIIHPYLLIIVIFSIALGSGGSAAINMWYDHDIDIIMKRTQNRALPLGKITPSDALALGIILSIISVLLILTVSNVKAALLLSLAILFYVVIYTIWLKRRTPQNIVIGGAAGAFPPLISYVSITNDISFQAIILFLIIFLWTPPHFWALALYRNDDYTKANIPMLPVVKGVKHTVINIFIYSVLLITATYSLIFFSNKLGLIYIIMVSLANIYFLYAALKLMRHVTEKNSMGLFKYSILYLFIVFLAVIIDALF